MTKSTITREESVQAVFDLKAGYRLGFADIEILKRVARMALAAMDGEPVAEVLSNRPGNDTSTIDRALPVGTQLYRHAQQPVVPDEIKHRIGGLDWGWEGEFNRGWNACRAAMLQELQKSAGDEVISRSNENVQVLNTIKASPALGSFPKTGEVQNTNPPENPGCCCRACRPVVLNDMRFVVCPDCGNKRCPRVNDHRNACTGSNEPGQEGSSYPDTPREVK